MLKSGKLSRLIELYNAYKYLARGGLGDSSGGVRSRGMMLILRLIIIAIAVIVPTTAII